LLLVAAVVVLGSSIFSASYLKRYAGHYSLKSFSACYLLLFASIVLVRAAEPPKVACIGEGLGSD
jgi:hypothetical protein